MSNTKNIHAYLAGSQSSARRVIEVSMVDYYTFQELDRDDDTWLVVHDLAENTKVDIRWTDCGLDCRCAAEWRIHTAKNILSDLGKALGKAVAEDINS